MTSFRINELHGIHAALYILFDENGKLDRTAMHRQTKLCLASGVHGMIALNTANDVLKLNANDRKQIVKWLAEDTEKQVPFGVTIYGCTLEGQLRQARYAQDAGADWLVLQPSITGDYSKSDYLRFIKEMADHSDLPLAIQDASSLMMHCFNQADTLHLIQQYSNIQLIKSHSSAVNIASVIKAIDNRLPVFNNNAGLELVDNLRVGCSGFLLTPDCIDYAVRIYEFFCDGWEPEAENLYRSILPAAVFMMLNCGSQTCYGKQLFGIRAGIPIFDQSSTFQPTETGLEMIRRFAADLKGFEED